MARLRIRIELSRGGAGVPLHKLASVVEEARKFFEMLADDVHIGNQRGEWLGFDFNPQSLNFTAEYVGAVTPEQVRDFYAAFDGTTALRRTTIAQFARITEAIGEDELIGFGLFLSERDPEPAEWRCLSRRDALRIADEIRVLSGASNEQPSHLPAVGGAGTSLFGRGREEETGLAARLSRVEQKVDEHSTQLRDLRSQSAAAEESFRHLLTAVEGFCGQAAQQIERVTPGALPAPQRDSRRWILYAIAGVMAAALVLIAVRLAPARSAEPELPAVSAAVPTPVPAPVATPAPRAEPMHIEIAATEPSWVAMTDGDGNPMFAGLVSPGSPRTVEVSGQARLRTGNAGGLVVKLNGEPLPVLGPRGKIRDVEFKDNTFTIVTPR